MTRKKVLNRVLRAELEPDRNDQEEVPLLTTEERANADQALQVPIPGGDAGILCGAHWKGCHGHPMGDWGIRKRASRRLRTLREAA